jgi:uncharacterized membrane protein (DUF373 family)
MKSLATKIVYLLILLGLISSLLVQFIPDMPLGIRMLFFGLLTIALCLLIFNEIYELLKPRKERSSARNTKRSGS